MPLDDQTTVTLRRDIYGKGTATRADLVRLLEMRRVEDAASPSFDDLMAEVATDVMVNEVDPPKYIQQADADWLVAQFSGGFSGLAEYDTLTRVIRSAVSVPASLAAFAVCEIERAIISGSARRPAGVLAQEDLEALRTAVFAATDGSSLHVTRDSAEALFRIADATAGANNAPGFEEFFAKAIGNYLMGIAFRWTSTAAEAKRIGRWLDTPPEGLGQFLTAMLDIDRIGASDYDAEAVDAAQNEADAEALARAAPIDAAEAEWLIARLNRDGVISPAEKRLLCFLRDESPAIAPALSALIEKAA